MTQITTLQSATLTAQVNHAPSPGATTAGESQLFQTLLSELNVGTPAMNPLAGILTENHPTTNVTLGMNLDDAQPAYTGTYNASDPSDNMTSGNVQPQFERPITVYDSTGQPHTLLVNFLETADSTWSVEIAAQPAGDVTSPDGQVAHGTITFNANGSLNSVSPSLSAPIAVHWTDGAKLRTAQKITSSTFR